MQQARRLASDHKHQRVGVAITAMTETGERLSVAAVARRAGVSRSFVHVHHRDEIELAIARDVERFAAGAASAARVTAASLKAECSMLREQAGLLRRENQALRRRLSELLGLEVAASALPAQRADQAALTEVRAVLEARDQQLFEANQHADHLQQDLDAAREANRALIRQASAATKNA